MLEPGCRSSNSSNIPGSSLFMTHKLQGIVTSTTGMAAVLVHHCTGIIGYRLYGSFNRRFGNFISGCIVHIGNGSFGAARSPNAYLPGKVEVIINNSIGNITANIFIIIFYQVPVEIVGIIGSSAGFVLHIV